MCPQLFDGSPPQSPACLRLFNLRLGRQCSRRNERSGVLTAVSVISNRKTMRQSVRASALETPNWASCTFANLRDLSPAWLLASRLGAVVWTLSAFKSGCATKSKPSASSAAAASAPNSPTGIVSSSCRRRISSSGHESSMATWVRISHNRCRCAPCRRPTFCSIDSIQAPSCSPILPPARVPRTAD